MFDLLDMIIVRPIVNILFVIYSGVGDFGLAIIIFTVIVKFAMWPLMRKQLHQTRIMREIQPELAEIKKRCNGNKQLESLQMMDLYKRKNVKPFRSMLTIFIQLPIFIALFTAINVMVQPRAADYNVEKSAYYFVEPLENVQTVIKQQQSYFGQLETDKDNAVYEFSPKLLGQVDLGQRAGFGSKSQIALMVFVLGSAILQYVMQKQQDPSRQKGKKRKTMKQLMQEAADGKEPDQTEVNAIAQQQMTFMMPLMMFFIMVNLPGAIVFYYFLNNCITVVLQKIIQHNNLDEMEEKADKSLVRELKKTEKELKHIQEAQIVGKTDTKDGDEPHITRVKSSSGIYKTNKNKNEKVHVTRISASNKKKRR